MWCKHCGQDVPGVAHGPDGRPGCPRCGGGSITVESRTAAIHAVGLANLANHGLDLSGGPTPSDFPNPKLDDWALAEELRQLRLSLGGTSVAAVSDPGKSGPQESGHRLRADAAHAVAGVSNPGKSGASTPLPSRQQRRGGSMRRTSVLAWIATWLGLTTFVCGVGLLAWSFIDERPELWTVGMPITLAGQFGLLFGLVLQLDRLRHDNSQTVQKLGDVDAQLVELKETMFAELKQTTTLLGAGGSSPSNAFYAHLATGASPQLLLADLKGQLDLVALRLTNGA